MRLQARSFWISKAGNSQDEYEDAFWPRSSVDREAPAYRFAVADGATETSFSGLWAQLLTRSWCRGQLETRRAGTFLPRLQRAWLEEVGAKPLPWYAEEKLRDGAYASLLGLALCENGTPQGRWRATAVGDSCLFQVRRDRLITSFPLKLSADFTSRPRLLSSKLGGHQRVEDDMTTASGDVLPGDRFLLMTDALASWFLCSVERRQKPWRTVARVEAQSGRSGDFSGWIDHLRRQGKLKNDDVTLLSVDVL